MKMCTIVCIFFVFLSLIPFYRLRELLEFEEKEFLKELEEKKETVLERQTKMRERAKYLQEKREHERQKTVADKLDQLFR